MQDIKIGDVVVSIAGHDIGEEYLVFKIENQTILLIDGKHKTIAKPKKKNIQHIRVLEKISNIKVGDFVENNPAFYAKVKKILKN